MKNFLIILFITAISSCSNIKQTIKVKGSDTEVNLSVLLAEAFYSKNQDIVVSISGGGSGMGIASLLNGNADIANSSRQIKTSELLLFEQNKVQIDSFLFAEDAIAFVVSDQNTIDSISIDHLSQILSGKQINWEMAKGIQMPINIYGRQSNSGTYEFVKHKLNIKFSSLAKQMNGNAQILEAIKADQSGIGYVGAGYVMGDNLNGLKVLKIYSNNEAAVSPLDDSKIEKGMYMFQRPLYQYYKKDSYKKVKPFLDFERSDKGRSIIRHAGYYNL